jgi:uncharacterized protein (TIGR03382 family)
MMRLGVFVLAGSLLLSGVAAAIDRVEVIDRAKAYCFHPWTCTAANLQASCDSAWYTYYVVGDQLGLPYDWGGFVSLHQFDLDIANGEAAGSPIHDPPTACTTGVDCSGFVSEAWATPQKYGTWTIQEISTPIQASQLKPGDALNLAGSHIVLFGGTLADGSPIYYESTPPSVRVNWTSGWGGFSGFDPIRYNEVTEGASDLGTLSNPIPITHWPYTDSRDTNDSQSDLLDACGAAPATRETGREYIYSFTTTQPGHLTASISDGTGVDIDIELFTDLAERDCIARNNPLIDLDLVSCGTYWLVADSWVDANGVEYAGPYTLTVTFTPQGGACQPMPGYDFVGGPGGACAWGGSEELPFCNPNLGVDTCLYTQDDPPVSFCSRYCQTTADCTADFPGGCCADIGGGELYCLIQSFCGPPPQDGGTDAGVDAGRDGGDPGRDAGSDSGYDAGSDPGPGDPGPGDPGQGDPGQGDPGQGDLGPGDPGQADAGPGDPGPGDPGQGDSGPGDPGSADPGSGADPGGGADSGHSCPAGFHWEETRCVSDEAPGGCGCQTSPPAPILSLLVGLWVLRRRRCQTCMNGMNGASMGPGSSVKTVPLQGSSPRSSAAGGSGA